jgi:hypothetical protein
VSLREIGNGLVVVDSSSHSVRTPLGSVSFVDPLLKCSPLHRDDSPSRYSSILLRLVGLAHFYENSRELSSLSAARMLSGVTIEVSESL